MKTLIITILLTILPIFVSSQISEIEDDTTYVYEELDTTSIIIDYKFTDIILDNFVTDACKYGLDSSKVVNHIKKLDAIYIDNLPEGKLGATIYIKDTLSPFGIRGIILIDTDLIFNFSIYKFTLYHELGHWFGLDHTKSGIMFENSDNLFKILDKWDKEVKKLMRKIKNNGYSYPELDTE